MDSTTAKIGAAAAGGYLLGRTKKGKAAISLALWLSGRNYRVRDVGRAQVVKLLQSEEGKQLIGQLRGPALAATKQALLAVYEAQASKVADGLQTRIGSLGDDVTSTAQKSTKKLLGAGKQGGADEQLQDAGKSVGGAAKRLGRLRRQGSGSASAPEESGEEDQAEAEDETKQQDQADQDAGEESPRAEADDDADQDESDEEDDQQPAAQDESDEGESDEGDESDEDESEEEPESARAEDESDEEDQSEDEPAQAQAQNESQKKTGEGSDKGAEASGGTRKAPRQRSGARARREPARSA